jgi:predicted transcriptional regulator
MKPVVFHAEAEEELRSAAEFYESRSEGLGIRFLDDVEQGLVDPQVDRDVAYRDLKELVELGLVTEPAKPGRAAGYHVVRGGAAASVPLTPQRVLAARMAEGGSIQNTDYREAFGVDRREATATLNRLVNDGVVVRVGERRGTRYQPGPRWEAWVGGGQLGA